MFVEKPHEVTAPPVQPVSPAVRVSRTLTVILVLMLVAGAGTAAWWYITQIYQPRQSSAANTNTVSNSTAAPARDQNSNSSFSDSDNDGLYDQAELLYGTDPRVPDTDGDGFVDGEEVKNGYEPLIAQAGKRMVDLALVGVITKSVERPIVVSSGMSEADRQRYYLMYDGSSTAYFSADGSLVAQCTNDNDQGKCGTLPNEIRTDFSRTFSDGKTTDTFRAPF